MKKTYITPAVEVINVNVTSSILKASSLTVDGNTSVDTSQPDTQLGRDENLSTPSIWDQKWD